MLAHISFAVKNFEQSKTFYDATLQILGYQRVFDFEDPVTKILWSGYGENNEPYFWITSGGNEEEKIGSARGFHVCFNAPNVEKIKQWYEKCLELGGKDNGKPGKREEYGDNYYGAFIVDPNGWRIEVFGDLSK
jgi:catechol 2,3-dioxygenase-like lactoylglutathione lyase family enzyme